MKQQTDGQSALAVMGWYPVLASTWMSILLLHLWLLVTVLRLHLSPLGFFKWVTRNHKSVVSFPHRKRLIRYQCNAEALSLNLQKKLNRYAPISLSAELTGLTEDDKEALILLIHAARLMDDIFHQQVWFGNPSLREWLKGRAHLSCLDENEAFFTTADSAIGLLPESTKPIPGWNGIEYKAAFPMQKPAGASFYPPDMDKMVKFVHVYKWQSCKLLQVDSELSF
ncbi:hypothetical protein L2E82_50027 [Cichorium intybus]|nr:hypothetical protein L2E82_50027 [Cichorium intybus]